MRFIAAWLLYLLGDAISRVMYDPIGGALYRPYNWCMLTSGRLQGERRGRWWPWNYSNKPGDQSS